MKKFAITASIVFALFLLCSCNKDNECFDRISQLRDNVFYCEGDGLTVYAYPETREVPFEEDGYVGEKKNYVIFKLVAAGNKRPPITPSLKFELGGKNYSKQFDYSSLSLTLYCQVEVESLPIEDFSVSLDFCEEEKTLLFTSLKKNSVFSYRDIINLAKDCNNITVKDFFKNPDKYELRIRLLEESGFNYWYVGISGKDNVALLYDSETGELLAVR